MNDYDLDDHFRAWARRERAEVTTPVLDLSWGRTPSHRRSRRGVAAVVAAVAVLLIAVSAALLVAHTETTHRPQAASSAHWLSPKERGLALAAARAAAARYPAKPQSRWPGVVHYVTVQSRRGSDRFDNVGSCAGPVLLDVYVIGDFTFITGGGPNAGRAIPQDQRTPYEAIVLTVDATTGTTCGSGVQVPVTKSELRAGTVVYARK